MPSEFCLVTNRLKWQAMSNFVLSMEVTVLDPENLINWTGAVGKLNITEVVKRVEPIAVKEWNINDCVVDFMCFDWVRLVSVEG